MKILIFGGTREALDLANELVDRGHFVTTSLAGVTKKPRLPKGKIQTGGFGGVEGLCRYIEVSEFAFVVDATHPFAVKISHNISKACALIAKPMLRLLRPQWHPQKADCWQRAENIAEAVRFLPEGARALVTVGRQRIEPFMACKTCQIYIRSIEPPQMDLAPHMQLILARPPFHVADEIALMEEKRITHLITKNAGGAQTEAKLDAARMLGITTIMISRPLLPPVDEVGDVAAALDAIARFTS